MIYNRNFLFYLLLNISLLFLIISTDNTPGSSSSSSTSIVNLLSETTNSLPFTNETENLNYTTEQSTTTTTTGILTTTTSTAVQMTTSVVKKPNRIEEIKEILKLDAIQKCSYESNPYIIALCPSYSEALMSQSNDTHLVENPDFLRLADIEKALIYLEVIDNLHSNCKSGEWCLGGDDYSIVKNVTIGSYILTNYGKSFCMLSSCYDEMKDYVSHCASSEILKGLFNMIPILCAIYNENVANDYCLDETSKLVHVTYALLHSNRTNNNNSTNYDEKNVRDNYCN